MARRPGAAPGGAAHLCAQTAAGERARIAPLAARARCGLLPALGLLRGRLGGLRRARARGLLLLGAPVSLGALRLCLARLRPPCGFALVQQAASLVDAFHQDRAPQGALLLKRETSPGGSHGSCGLIQQH